MSSSVGSFLLRHPYVVCAVMCTLLLLTSAVVEGCSSQIRLAASGPVFDDFNGPAGSAPSGQIWDYDVGGGGWANNELQVYTNSPDNVRLDGQGHLVIEAQRSSSGYSSARLVTRGKADILYGTVAARIKFPASHGLLPAFWMIGSNVDKVGWPQCGEIDVMEMPFGGSNYYSTLHGPWSDKQDSTDWQVQSSGPISDLTSGFHDYWVTRQPDRIEIGVDNRKLATFTPSSLPAGAHWVFNQPMYAILNIAVGGGWVGPPDDSTHFPATMVVDSFRYTPADRV